MCQHRANAKWMSHQIAKKALIFPNCNPQNCKLKVFSKSPSCIFIKFQNVTWISPVLPKGRKIFHNVLKTFFEVALQIHNLFTEKFHQFWFPKSNILDQSWKSSLDMRTVLSDFFHQVPIQLGKIMLITK